ncbi:MAG: hypothetical protein MdMp014T_0084 [Treponematales bacterium]
MRSVVVVFPASMCAIIPMFRIVSSIARVPLRQSTLSRAFSRGAGRGGIVEKGKWMKQGNGGRWPMSGGLANGEAGEPIARREPSRPAGALENRAAFAYTAVL